VERRKLGRSGIEVGAVGMGCWAIGGPWRSVDADGRMIPAGWSGVDDDESIRAVHAALDAGVTLFDTAANYGAGHSERVLGRALQGHRDGVVIATKFGHLVDEDSQMVRTDHARVLPNLRSDCEASLRRLGTDYIDLYQLHVDDYDPEAAVAVREALEDLVEEGMIRAYGWSTDRVESARVFAAGEAMTAVQFAYNIFYERYGLRDLVAAADLGGIARSPLGMGILTGELSPDTTFPDDDVRTHLDLGKGRHRFLLDWASRVKETLTAGGHTPAQGALAWILTSDERIVPIPGVRTAAHVTENAGVVAKGPLSTEQMVRIEGFRAACLEGVRAYYRSPADGAQTDTDGWPLR